jgi:hypothetical protein
MLDLFPAEGPSRKLKDKGRRQAPHRQIMSKYVVHKRREL